MCYYLDTYRFKTFHVSRVKMRASLSCLKQYCDVLLANGVDLFELIRGWLQKWLSRNKANAADWVGQVWVRKQDEVLSISWQPQEIQVHTLCQFALHMFLTAGDFHQGTHWEWTAAANSTANCPCYGPHHRVQFTKHFAVMMFLITRKFVLLLNYFRTFTTLQQTVELTLTVCVTACESHLFMQWSSLEYKPTFFNFAHIGQFA